MHFANYYCYLPNNGVAWVVGAAPNDKPVAAAGVAAAVVVVAAVEASPNDGKADAVVAACKPPNEAESNDYDDNKIDFLLLLRQLTSK